MKLFRLKTWIYLAVPGALVYTLGGCLGPSPGYFIGTSAANATISTLVSTFWINTVGVGVG